MELRGYRRANKPQSGLFSRHYYTTSCPLFNLDGAVRKRSVPAARSSQLVEKVFSTSFLRFQNFQKVLKSIDLNDAGHPSFPFSCLLTEELFLSKASGFDFGKLQREIPILSDGESTGLPPEPSAAVPVGKRRKSLSGA